MLLFALTALSYLSLASSALFAIWAFAHQDAGLLILSLSGIVSYAIVLAISSFMKNAKEFDRTFTALDGMTRLRFPEAE